MTPPRRLANPNNDHTVQTWFASEASIWSILGILLSLEIQAPTTECRSNDGSFFVIVVAQLLIDSFCGPMLGPP